MRIVTWNVKRATTKSPVWQLLLELSPDVVLLQEVNGFSDEIKEQFDIKYKHAITKDGNKQSFGTAVMVKGKIIEDIELVSKHDWVNKELSFFSGNILGCVVEIQKHSLINVMSVYSPAWPVNKKRIRNIDVSDVKLENNPDVWATEILWSGLKERLPSKIHQWVIAGDFNASETFDYMWAGGPRGNKIVLDRMNDLGLIECLKLYKGELTPTFKNLGNNKVIHQLDHLFVNNDFATNLKQCVTGDQEKIFGESISDHLPVIADFSV